MMLAMKILLLYWLLLGSSTLAATVPVARRPNRKLAFNPKIRPGEINEYLHPEIRITKDSIDCAGTEPILVDGKVHGCFFTNTEEEILAAIEALTIAKNLTDVVEDPALENPLPLSGRSYDPDSAPVSPLVKRATYQFERTYCHPSGVYGRVRPDIQETSRMVCPSMDNLAGRVYRIGIDVNPLDGPG
ncbi:hypothetical protein TWF281_004541 [Arthrobotrys megalospora]